MDDKTLKAHDLLHDGKITELKKLIDSDKSINYKIPDSHGNSLIDYIVQTNNSDLLQSIIKNKILFDAINNSGKNILYFPIKHFNNRIIETIIKYQSNILNIPDNNNFYPFHYAIKYNNLEALEILDKNLKILTKNIFYESIKDNNNNSLFHYVILNNPKNTEKIMKILNVQTIEDNVNYDNTSLLMDLIGLISDDKRNKDILDFVNTKIKNINYEIQDKKDDNFLFKKLVDNNLSEYIIFYLEKSRKDNIKRNLNIQDKKCQTIVHILLRNIYTNPESGEKNIKVLNYLFDNENINYNIYDLKLKYPINLFLKLLNYYKLMNIKEKRRRNIEIYDKLVEYGKKLILKSDLNFQDLNYNSSVHLLCKYKFFNLFKDSLKTKKINISLINKDNKSPLDYLTDDKKEFIDIFIESYENYLKNHKIIQSQFNNDCIKNMEKCKKTIKSTLLSGDLNSNKNLLSDLNITKNNIKIGDLKTKKDVVINNVYLGSSLDIICGCKYLLNHFKNAYFPYNKKATLNTQYMIIQFFKFNDISYNNEVIFEDNFIYWYPEKLSLYINPYVNEKIMSKKDKKDFIFIPLIVLNPENNINHMNMLYFMDNKIYHYDPYGLYYKNRFNFDNLEEKINKEFKNQFEYVNPINYLKKAGIQMLEESDTSLIYFNDTTGYCIIWCILFSFILFDNKNLSFDKIIKYMIINFYQNKINLKTLIKNYLLDVIDVRNKVLENYKIDINQYYNDNIPEIVYINIINNLKYKVGENKINIDIKDTDLMNY